MIKIVHGDCRKVLPTLPADHFDCIVTSPPYWGLRLRDYGVAGQIGLEPTLDAYIETMAVVADELWRVLKPSGTFWLNLGDSYSSAPVGRFNGGGFKDTSALNGTRDLSGVATSGQLDRARGSGLKPKDLCGVPWRVAFALQARGWWLRSAIVWAKPNPMPESVNDRPTSSYEMVFLLTKAERYLYDAEAIAEPSLRAGDYPGGQGGFQDETIGHYKAGLKRNGERPVSETRNARNVWTIATQPYSGAHFATMPPDLAERCIKAGCPVGGHVLDPFGGAGTTGLVADRLGRDATLVELNRAYGEMQRNRIADDSPLFADII